MIWERGAPLKSCPPLNIFELEAWHLIYGIMDYGLSWILMVHTTCTVVDVGAPFCSFGPKGQNISNSQPTAPTWLSKSAKMAELTICSSCLESVTTGRSLSKTCIPSQIRDTLMTHSLNTILHSTYFWVIMAIMSKMFTWPFCLWMGWPLTTFTCLADRI